MTTKRKNNPGQKLTAKQKRQEWEIEKSELARGKSKKEAQRIGAATVRKQAKAKNPHFNVYRESKSESGYPLRSYVGMFPGKTKAEAISAARRSHFGGRLPKGNKLVAELSDYSKEYEKKNPKRKKNKTIIKAKRVVVLNKGKKRNAAKSSHPAKAPAKPRAGSARSGHKSAKGRPRKSVANKRAATPKKPSIKSRKRRNPSAAEIRQDFAGRYNRDETLIFPDGTPQGLAKLGKLVSIKTEEGTIAAVKGTAWLCSDTKGKLHIGTPTAGHVVFGGPAHDYGKIREIEYQERKPHLGYHNETLFFHKLGEETGVKPRLVTDGKGGAKVIGGAYRISREGIVN